MTFTPTELTGDALVIAALRAAKDQAYSERNKLVAMISGMFPARLGRHDPADREWEDDWRWIVFIDLPTGQVSWHIHDLELSMFDHLERTDSLTEWDGHTTDEKYARCLATIGMVYATT